jgi:HEAT repeat protein
MVAWLVVVPAVLLLLAVTVVHAWEPFKIRRLEHRVWTASGEPRADRTRGARGQCVYRCPRVDAARQLAGAGPRAYASFRRLLRSDDRWVRIDALRGLTEARSTWALPLIIEAAKDEHAFVVLHAIVAIEDMTGKRYLKSYPHAREHPRIRAQILRWWESEGEARYGRPE